MINLNPTTASSGAGIDVTSVVEQVLYAERAPERLWQQQQSKLTTEASALNSLKTGLTTLGDKVNSLKDILGVLTNKIAASSATSILTASAQASAVAGSHVIKVANLAATSSYYTDPVAADAMLANGSFTIQVGTNPAQTVTIDATNNKMAGLAQSINDLKIGVRASVISDVNGARLALVSETSGEPGDLTIAANTTGLAFTKAAAGHNAQFTLDGIPLSSASNTVVGVLQGVTLQLATAVPDTEVVVTVGPDVEGATRAIQEFVDAYNAAIQSINQQYAVTGAGTAGPLASNSSLRAIQSQLLSAATYTVSGNSSFVNLASLGVKMNNDGTLTVDAAKLKDATASHFDDVESFFHATGSGFANQFSAGLSTLTDSTQGLLSLNLNENSSAQRNLAKQIEQFEDRLATREQFLIEEYSRIDTMLRQLPLLQSQISSQLNAVSKG